jgi:hypothetical protein
MIPSPSKPVTVKIASPLLFVLSLTEHVPLELVVQLSFPETIPDQTPETITPLGPTPSAESYIVISTLTLDHGPFEGVDSSCKS